MSMALNNSERCILSKKVSCEKLNIIREYFDYSSRTINEEIFILIVK